MTKGEVEVRQTKRLGTALICEVSNDTLKMLGSTEKVTKISNRHTALGKIELVKIKFDSNIEYIELNYCQSSKM